MNPNLLVVCCSVLKNELREVLKNSLDSIDMVFPDSMLHMHPRQLHRELERIVSADPGRSCLMVYGDCHPHMETMERHPHRARTRGKNCGEILLGINDYRVFQRERTFLFLPEWTERWKEVFQVELGFSDPALARDFMSETRKNLVYLDTGLGPVPASTLDDISQFFGMPVETIRVSLDHLADAVEKALNQLGNEAFHEP